MNFPYSSIVVTLAIYIFMENISAEEISLVKDHYQSALAVIKKRDSTLQLGIPYGYKTYYAFYKYDGTIDKNGLKEEFLFACPTRKNFAKEANIEYRLKYIKKELSEDTTLFFTHEYWDRGNTCSYDVEPSVKKSEKRDSVDNAVYCGHDGEIYDVGYPVVKPSDDDEEELKIQFMSIYQICHSTVKDKGTLYTIHHIESPSLLLQRLWEFYTFDPKEVFKSSLDKSDEENDALFNKHFAYQLVGFDDMPTRPWGYTTLFYFNYVSIPKNKDLLTGMIAVDNYIRLFSKNKKRLTLYSGSYQATKNIPPIFCLSAICDPKPTLINSFWRIITDDEKNAVIIITQYTLIPCYQDMICDENQAIVQKYKKGGCTYTCSVTPDVIHRLGLRGLEIKEFLTLKFTQKVPTDETQTHQDGQLESPVNPPKDISIHDIVDKKKFMEALKNVAKEVRSTTGNRSFIPEKRSDGDDCGGSGSTGCFGGGGGRNGGGGGGGSSWFTWGAGTGYVAGAYDGGTGGGDAGVGD